MADPLPRLGYFEGILQLRPATPEIMEFLYNESQENPRFQVTRQKELPSGNIDLFVSSQKVLQQVAKKLNSKFFGIMKLSKRLHSTDHLTQKMKYRVYILFRPLDIQKGTAVHYKSKDYLITLIGEGKVQLKEQKSGKKIWAKLEDLL